MEEKESGDGGQPPSKKTRKISNASSHQLQQPSAAYQRPPPPLSPVASPAYSQPATPSSSSHNYFAQPSTPYFFQNNPFSPQGSKVFYPGSPYSLPYTPASQQSFSEDQYSESEDDPDASRIELPPAHLPPPTPQSQNKEQSTNTPQQEEDPIIIVEDKDTLWEDAFQLIQNDHAIRSPASEQLLNGNCDVFNEIDAYLTGFNYSLELDVPVGGVEGQETTAAQNLLSEEEVSAGGAISELGLAVVQQSADYFLWDGLPITHSLYSDLYNSYANSGLVPTAKLLFFAVFTPQELASQTLSGKKGGGPRSDDKMLSPVKLLAIERLLGYIKHAVQKSMLDIPNNETCHAELPDILTQEDITSIEKSVYTHQRSQTMRKLENTPEPVTFLPSQEAIHWSPGHEPISLRKWAQIMRERDHVKAGKILFSMIFKSEEIENCKIRDRNFDSFKVEVFNEIMHCQIQNRKHYPYSFQPINPFIEGIEFRSQIDAGTREEFKQAVFIRKRSQIRQNSKPPRVNVNVIVNFG